ncbi:uncharacterized protein N7498_006783 [Penicillium cinerascens]|uniref:FAD/NAD(P)-binding domain-containing protein n=1 Tax=Penicillium cinerascens TaxID=70096 RepID=A0A9W9MIX8_9EURO|nr:uncharacterized protein N7498_006783 [Penicillium cinerascens]KAJ5202120.1 hypothetical protein N7498_006783 [Penicillium cinerascens]
MERVVIVGAGLYGLIAAKTYLHVSGAYDREQDLLDETEAADAIPDCFNKPRSPATGDAGGVLVLDSASDIGGTWAEERLYPNLLSQNSYGLYEFSDLPLADVVEKTGVGQQFIAGWKINRYLHAWVSKWRLRKHIRLNWRVRVDSFRGPSVFNRLQVDSIQRLASKEWKLNIRLTATNSTFSLICDKLILATGLTSVPNLPDIETPEKVSIPAPILHAKDIGIWARAHLGYRPMPGHETKIDSTPKAASPKLRSVAVYGGAKSSFDLVHFFATLHRKDPSLHLTLAPEDPVQVHWIIRKKGNGPSWMAPPTSALPNGEVVASDKAASTRFLHHLTPCSSETPGRLSFENGSLKIEGSWLARLFHGNPLGRWWVRWFWDSLDRSLEGLAQYEAEAKMQLLRPNKSVISCGSSIGIANQPDLWEMIRSPQVKVYRSTIRAVSALDAGDDGPGSVAKVTLANGRCIDEVDLVIHATGYKPVVPIKVEPPSFRLHLGLSGLVNPALDGNDHDKLRASDPIEVPMDSTVEDHIQHWAALDRETEPIVRNTLAAAGCVTIDCSLHSWTGDGNMLPYRLFRRMVPPTLLAEDDRSFATLGVVLTSTIAIVAEVQALWAVAFLTGGFDAYPEDSASDQSDGLCLGLLSPPVMEGSISEDVVLGSLTGTGLEVDAIHYNDILMRDLGLNPCRLGGGCVRELIGVYEPSAYAGIVDEWRKRRGRVLNSN